MRFDPEAGHGANNGLNVARDLLEDVKKEFPWISYGDLWTLAGVAAIQELGGPKVPWRPGRIDGFAAQCTPDGRLPDAAQGADHVRNVSIPGLCEHRASVADVGARDRSSTAWASTTKKLLPLLVLTPLDDATLIDPASTARGRSPPLF